MVFIELWPCADSATYRFFSVLFCSDDDRVVVIIRADAGAAWTGNCVILAAETATDDVGMRILSDSGPCSSWLDHFVVHQTISHTMCWSFTPSC